MAKHGIENAVFVCFFIHNWGRHGGKHVAAQGWNEGFSENQFMEKNVIKVSVDANRLDTP